MLHLCERFHCLPSQLRAEDAEEISDFMTILKYKAELSHA